MRRFAVGAPVPLDQVRGKFAFRYVLDISYLYLSWRQDSCPCTLGFFSTCIATRQRISVIGTAAIMPNAPDATASAGTIVAMVIFLKCGTVCAAVAVAAAAACSATAT